MKNNLKEVIKNLKDHIFTYSLSDGGFGIVLSSNEEDAREKVRAAYQKHGGYEDKKNGWGRNYNYCPRRTV